MATDQVKFQLYRVTKGALKAKVSYSAHVHRSLGKVVTLYSKDYRDGLHDIFPDLYKNDSDSMTDYFEKGQAMIPEGHPLYAEALVAAEARNEKIYAKQVARLAKRTAARRGAS